MCIRDRFGFKNTTDDEYRFFIGDGGCVGIGTCAPLEKLHVCNGNIRLANATTNSAGTGGPLIMFGDSSSEVGVSGGISFTEAITLNNYCCCVSMGMFYDGINNRLVFNGPGSNSGGMACAMRLSLIHI